MKRLVAFTLITYSLTTNVLAQTFEKSKDFQKAYALLLDLRFEEAEKHIQAIRVKEKENLSVVYLEDLGDFLYIVVNEDQKAFELRKGYKQQRLNALRSLPSNSPERLLTEGEIHLHWAFSSMRFGEYLSAASGINKAFSSLEKNIKKHPDYLPTYKSMGLLHTLIGTVPDNYKWATKLMGIEGTIEQGISEMEMVLTNSVEKPEFANLKKETLFLLTFLNINLLNSKSNLARFKPEIEAENGPLMDFALASLLKEQGLASNAIELLDNKQTSRKRFPYLNYLLGEMKLARMDSNADVPFIEYINTFHGNSYKKSAQQKLAWFELLVKDSKPGYWKEINRVDAFPSTILDEDKAAQTEYEKETIPNSVLLRARLQFDGGFYKTALNTLIKSQPSDLSSNDEKLEFTYRLARIHHLLGNTNDAIAYYELTMKTGKESKRYFAANAALQLGLLYETISKKFKALDAFEKCSTFNNSEYKNSINQKAKAGILRVSRP